jgi:chemotaxis protein MotB
MARRRKHEEHANHEAWAIPYGDLVTLLLAFFVVMYAISSVNAGKYRVVSDALSAAFRGQPQTDQPVPVGQRAARADTAAPPQAIQAPSIIPPSPPSMQNAAELENIARSVEQTLANLVMQEQVIVRNQGGWVEVEIRNDILFGSGSATLATSAEPIIGLLADVLRDVPNPVRVEGHTDNVPIRTAMFPSNWELSAARAASVVRLLSARGLPPSRLAVLGLGEFRPVAANDTAEGRNANRRVLVVILGSENGKTTAPDAGAATPMPSN